MTLPAKPPSAAGARPSPPPGRRRAAVVGALVAAFGGFAHFNLLLSALPAYALRSGSGASGAGALTGTLIATTLVVQPFTPWLFARLGRRRSLALSGALMALPSLPLAGVSSLPGLVALSAVRGLGFGVFVVAGVTFTAELFPPERRGRAMGWYGAAVGAAGVIGAPLGVALARQDAYGPAFALATGTAGLVLVGALGFPSGAPPARAAAPKPAVRRGPRLGARLRALRPLSGPLLVEVVSTTAYGVVFTFLPLGGAAAPAALLAAQVSCVAARLVGGGLIDRHGARRVLGPAVLLAALGTAGGALPDRPLPLLAGALLFGAGFGAVQSATLVLVMELAEAAETAEDRAGGTGGGLGRASVAWNVAFDAGTGLGALAGGPVFAVGGPPVLFTGTAVLLAAALLVGVPAPPAAAERA
ncbi:MFS transporter [Streptomyces sp. NPDC058417]|uniref:MFS transporter n=2 Tax=Streptomyces TaxID=1883 RepID=UPI00365DE9EA